VFGNGCSRQGPWNGYEAILLGMPVTIFALPLDLLLPSPLKCQLTWRFAWWTGLKPDFGESSKLRWPGNGPDASANRRENPFRSLLPALETLVSPHVTPVSVAPAIADTDFVQVAVDVRQS
jgi:hypothetical protein